MRAHCTNVTSTSPPRQGPSSGVWWEAGGSRRQRGVAGKGYGRGRLAAPTGWGVPITELD